MATKELTAHRGFGFAGLIRLGLGVGAAVFLGLLAVDHPLVALLVAGVALLAIAIVVTPDVATLVVIAHSLHECRGRRSQDSRSPLLPRLRVPDTPLSLRSRISSSSGGARW